jgi:4-hydroxybenzoate polyprenyltransferase
MLTAYVAISVSYSLSLKRKLLIDVFTLSGLYTLRIIAGGVVTGILLSGWLLSFSVFLFLSLGFSKRAAEIRAFNRSGKSSVAGRAYRKSDFLQLNQFGVASGFVSSLVLALYVGSDQVTRLYPEPAWLWLLVPAFLFWITRLWLLAYRGELNEDPVVFALTDRLTILLAGICLVFGLLATSGVRLGFMQ